MSRVIPRHIFPMLRKLDRKSAERTLVLPRHVSFHNKPRMQAKRFGFLNRKGVEKDIGFRHTGLNTKTRRAPRTLRATGSLHTIRLSNHALNSVFNQRYIEINHES